MLLFFLATVFSSDHPTIFCLILFYIRPSDFCYQFKGRRHFIGCFNHDIVIGLCSELHLRLSYYIHPRYGNKFLVSRGDRTLFLSNVSRQLYPQDQRANIVVYSRNLLSNHDFCVVGLCSKLSRRSSHTNSASSWIQTSNMSLLLF